MAILDKAKVAVGVQNKSKFDLSCDHITSASWMQLQPVYYRHMIPGEHISVNANAFTRLQPLQVPSFGRARLNMRAFFVPFRLCWMHFNEFITDSVSSNFTSTDIIDQAPYFKNSTLVSFFKSHGLEEVRVDDVTNGAVYDVFMDSKYFRFTWFGRRCWKVLRSFGYSCSWNDKDITAYSALPLLAYGKIYLDWYACSAYMDSNSYAKLERLFHHDVVGSSFELSWVNIYDILSETIAVNYDGDYFTAAWDSPAAPNGGNVSNDVVIEDVTMYNPSAQYSNQVKMRAVAGPIGGDTLDTPYFDTKNATQGLSQYSLSALRALSDMTKRHQLAGSRVVDRYLADWGINLKSDALLRSVYLGNNSIDIEISDVMSTANTASGDNPSTLGDYAGKGIGNGSKTFDYECQEFGIFVICASILPSGGYVQGLDRNILHLKRLDFFQPDFDNLGVQGIAKGEVYMPMRGNFYGSSGTGQQTSLFGFSPRYAEYKIPRSHFTGDLSLPSMNRGGAAWTLFRLFDDTMFAGAANVVHSLAFCRPDNDWATYNRMFVADGESEDKFNIIYHFNVASFAPCKSLFDTYDFLNKAREITLDANGVKVN